MATKKITITVPEELLESIRTRVDSRGVSAYIAEAAAHADAMDKLGELSAALEEEYGPLTAEELRAADAWLDEMDAKHEALRSGGEEARGQGKAAA
ncbi:hypothetical protein [Streptomyces sp. NBC_01006]|uniref:hypothetical protein n=1 Tax=Streptomyces sp. NBC_01006 TaxID=2903716 RepID=UPI00386852C8|nr:hypothetical protein OG509_16925 [Streptomyces sp. NBC_01006]